MKPIVCVSNPSNTTRDPAKKERPQLKRVQRARVDQLRDGRGLCKRSHSKTGARVAGSVNVRRVNGILSRERARPVPPATAPSQQANGRFPCNVASWRFSWSSRF
jgi:hypothetical protein